MFNEKKVKRNNKRATQRGKVGNLSVEGYNKNVEFYNGKCCYCDKEGNTLEHLNPLYLNGGTTQNNCVPACEPCNSDKGCEDLWEYIDRTNLEEWRIKCIEVVQRQPCDKFSVEITAEEYRQYIEEGVIDEL